MIPIIKHIAQSLGQIPSVEHVLLFGSRARGDHRERSDIDLAVMCPEASLQDWNRMNEIVEEAPTLLNIDLVRFDNAQESLQEEIRSEGLIVYERHKDRTFHA